MAEVDILYNLLDINDPVSTEVSLISEPFITAAPLETSTPKRKPAWSNLEQNVLIEAVSKYEQKLFGKFKGSGRGKPEREAAWEEVARTVNEYVLF